MNAPPRISQRDHAQIHAMDCRCKLCRLEAYANRPMTRDEWACWLAVMTLSLTIGVIGCFG